MDMFDLRTAKELKPKQQLMGGWMLRILKMSVYKKNVKKLGKQTDRLASGKCDSQSLK